MKLLALAALLLLAVAYARRERRERNPWNTLSPAERRALDEGLADLEAGRVVPWPLVSDNLTSVEPGWYDWRLSRAEWEALG